MKFQNRTVIDIYSTMISIHQGYPEKSDKKAMNKLSIQILYK